MAYTLIAKLDDMSREEAKAVVYAILQVHGSGLVDAQVDRWSKECAAERDAQRMVSQALKGD